MKILAELTFDYLWLLFFGGEEIIDLDYSVNIQENLSVYFSGMTDAEKKALSQAAHEAKSRLLAEPDEYGYTPRSLVTEEQKGFLEYIISLGQNI